MKRALIILFVFLASCNKYKSDLSSAKGNFEYANHLFENKQYDLALEAFRDVKKYSGLEYAAEADLKIADSYFFLRSYEEALYSYERFKEFYPTHKKSDYVNYQIVLCYYNRLPKTSDRDLTLAHNLLETLDLLIKNYPSFEKIEEATLKRKEIRNMLAQKELGIAHFYLKTKNYASALSRYLVVTKKFQDTNAIPASLLGAGKAHLMLNNRDESKTYLSLLLENHKSSIERVEALKIIEENEL